MGKLKNDLMLKLIQNPKIVKCLVNNQKDFLDVDFPKKFNPMSLLYKQIFPYKRMFDENNEEKTFITMSFNFQNKQNNNFFKVGSISFFVITHYNLLNTKYGILRYDYLMSQIDTVFNSTRGFGLGKLIWDNSYDFVTDNKEYLGCCITYRNNSMQ